MADYVVVDKDQLEADLATVGNAIRSKGGTTGKLAFPTGMKNAIDAIQKGIDTTSSNPVTSSDIVQGKEAFVNDEKVVGTMERHSWLNFYSEDMEIDGEGDLCIVKNLDKRYYVEDTFGAYANASVLGNAKPEDVAKGVFFSSSEGINIEGTAEPSSGGSISQIATGSFTSLGSGGVVTSVDCGFTPDVLFVHLPEGYTEGNNRYVNDIAVNLSATSGSCTGVSMSGDLYTGYLYVGLYVRKLESGFQIYSIYEQEMSGEYWYPEGKIYSYTAIKYT